MDFTRVTTKDLIAVMIVAGSLIFNGISLMTGRAVDAATIGLAGMVVGHYFKGATVTEYRELPLPAPLSGDND